MTVDDDNLIARGEEGRELGDGGLAVENERVPLGRIARANSLPDREAKAGGPQRRAGSTPLHPVYSRRACGAQCARVAVPVYRSRSENQGAQPAQAAANSLAALNQAWRVRCHRPRRARSEPNIVRPANRGVT